MKLFVALFFFRLRRGCHKYVNGITIILICIYTVLVRFGWVVNGAWVYEQGEVSQFELFSMVG